MFHTVRRWVVAGLTLLLGCSTIVGVGASAPAHADGDQGRLLLLLDSSGSMKEPAEAGQTKIEAAKRALGSVIDGLPNDADVGLRVYGAKVFSRQDPGACEDTQLVVPVGTVDKPALKSAIAKYRPYGETPIAYSLKQAAGDLGGDGKRTILLVSDGEETCDPDPCVVARELTQKGIDLRIDVVGFKVSGSARQQLQCIADNGNGAYYDADSAEDLAASLDKLSTRAYRPFEVVGEPVEGSSEPTTGTEITAGRYTTTIPVNNSATYFTVTKTPGSTLWVTATARPPRTSERTRSEIALEAAEVTGQCHVEGSEHTNNAENTHNVLVGSLLMDPGVDEAAECARAGRVVLAVGGAGETDAGNAGWDTELTIVEEPAVETTDDLPAPDTAGVDVPTESDWRGSATTEPVVGATTLSDAPTLTEGTYADTVVPGERLVYRVDATFGQHVTADVFIPKAGPALAKALPVERGQHVLPIYGRMYGPNGIDMTVNHDIPHGILSGVDDAAFSLVSPQIRYLNRTSDDNRLRGAAVDGAYYLEVNAPSHGDQTYAIPIQLRVAVQGDATGEPPYADLPETEEPAEPEQEQPAETEDSEDSAASTDDTENAASPFQNTALAIGFAGLGLAVLVLVVVLLVVILRRNQKAPTARGGPGPW